MRLSAACRALQPPHGLAARLGATLAIIDATKSPRPRAFAGSGGRAFNASHSSRLMNLCNGDGTVRSCPGENVDGVPSDADA